jgi:MYXO-CTERM domain-containing protein
VQFKRLGWLSSTAPVCVPLLFAIVACVSSLEFGETEQEATLPLAPYNFGNQQVNVASAARTFTIRPASGVQNSTVSSITESCPDFSIAAAGLPATVSNVCTGGSNCPSYITTTYSFTATFRPTVAQQVSCAVTIVIDSVPTTLTLSGTGTEPTVRLQISPSPSTTLDFGQVRVNETSTATSVLLRNFGSGPQPLTVSSVAFDSASVAKGFAVASGVTTSHVVAANGGSDPFTVTCRPTATGTHTGSLTIVTDDPAAPSTTLNVTCTGITSNLLFLPSSPAVIDGAQSQDATRVGEPVNITITLRNSGTATMTLHDLTLSSPELSFVSRPNANATIGINQTANVVLRYEASTAFEQGTIGTMTASYDTAAPRVINVLGAALPTSMSISPDGAVDLGPVCIDATASQSFFVLKNNPGTFRVTAIEATEPFVLGGMLPTSGALAIDTNAVSFTASVTPTTAADFAGTVSVTTDIPNEAPRMIALTARGLPDGITPTPTTLDLGSVSIGATSPGQTVVVTNCSAAPLSLLESLITGKNKDDFQIVVPPTTTTIDPGTSVSYVIVASPVNAGERTATLEVRHDSGTVEVPLLGNGTGDPIDERNAEESSYYSCSTAGAAAGAWPLGVLALVLWRRRKRA